MFKFLVSFFVASTAFAQCDDLYPTGKKITVPNTLELCNRIFVTVYDAKKHRNIFSSERIETNNLRIDRSNNFKIDQRVPYVKPSDYNNSGYDRGHMAPAGNAVDEVSMSESFYMTNMTPQAPKLNRGAWNQFETYVRKTWTDTYHVITGAVYSDKPIMIGKKKDIPVPKYIYKCIIDTETLCFLAENKDDALVYPVEVNDINRIAGFKVF